MEVLLIALCKLLPNTGTDKCVNVSLGGEKLDARSFLSEAIRILARIKVVLNQVDTAVDGTKDAVDADADKALSDLVLRF